MTSEMKNLSVEMEALLAECSREIEETEKYLWRATSPGSEASSLELLKWTRKLGYYQGRKSILESIVVLPDSSYMLPQGEEVPSA